MRSPEDILRDLRRIAVPDQHRCFGCGREHNCGLHGCAIIREAAALIEGLQASLSASEVARSDLGTLLAKTQQRLHEVESQLDAAVCAQQTLQVYAADQHRMVEALQKDLAACIDCCPACLHQLAAPPECECDCDCCGEGCVCKDCRDGSNFEWRGMDHGEG